MKSLRSWPDLGPILLLFLAPLLFFAPVTLGGRTLLPVDNLYQYEPWASYRSAQNVPEVPHNALLSDLIFQNYQWKSFLRQSLSEGEIPLWQAHQLGGTPFLANGQHSAYYPFSLLYYILPLWLAYGWFTVSQLWLAGLFMYLLIRGLGMGREAALIAGLSYQLSSFMIVASVHPMIQAGAAWLPLLVLMSEYIIQKRALGTATSLRVLPWVLIGGLGLGMNFLAGHVEITYYTLLILALYSALRLLPELKQFRAALQTGAWLLLMLGLGFGIGAAQFIPNVEAANSSFRTERSTLAEVRSYALPPRHALLWFMPNFYGNPAHHQYFDVFEGKTVPHEWTRFISRDRRVLVTDTDWGIKNYVEGGVYVGIFPLLLASLGLFHPAPRKWIWLVLGGIALLLMFGTPAYGILYHLLPGVKQLHTPFRWGWLLTFVICILAAYGVENTSRWEKWLRISTALLGAAVLGGLLLSRLLYANFESLIDRIFKSLAGASLVFPDSQAFYSYQFKNALIFGILLIVSAWLLWGKKYKRWLWLSAIVLFADFWLATGDFNPSARREWLNFTPPEITWLQDQQEAALAQGQLFRLQAYDWGEDPLIANLSWGYGLHDIRGYDSLFSKQYADYMGRIAPQTGLAYNRINPIFYDQYTALTAPELDRLNVRYILTDWIIHEDGDYGIGDLEQANLRLVQEFPGIRIYENTDALPHVYGILADAVDSSQNILWDAATISPAHISDYASSSVFTDFQADETSYLIFSGNYDAGWRAFVRPLGADEKEETEIPVERIDGIFRAVKVDAGTWTVRWRYSPQSFQLGAFTSFISGMLLIFLALMWLWINFVGERADQNSAQRVIKNSLAPILLNLFNRGIDFAFAFIMLRILAPEGAGIYYYAIVVFGWFDILTNFGLNTLLTREVARDQSQAQKYFINTTVLRLILAGVGVLFLLVFLGLRNALISPALDQTAMIAIALLYLGLIPNSLSTGLTALFYAFEKAEYPAALATVTTLVKVSLGLGALLLGWGVIGLAGVSILTNLVTLFLMLRLALPLMRRVGEHTSPLSRPLMRGMMLESYPLMINHLLATVFFKSDVILMEAINGAAVVGVYSTAYKWLDALNIIPAFFTLALLPMMSRQAQENKTALRRNYLFGFKVLVMIALPTAISTTFLAPALIGILGGREFLPDGGIALQIMIWSIPIGWINSLTQYVLIALNRQSQITGAFVLAVSFNIVGNLIFMPQYGYRAAALTTIFSELVLLVAFYRLLRQDLGAIHYGRVLGKNLFAAGGMLALFGFWMLNPVLGLLAGILGYLLLLVLLNPFTAEESELLKRVLPAPLKKYALGVEAPSK